MTAFLRHCVVWPILALSVACGLAFAEDDEPVAAGVEAERFVVNQRTLEQWIVGGRTTDGTVRVRFESQLRDELARWTAACELSGVQKQKLELAGRGDIKHFFDEFNAQIRRANERSKNGLVDQATLIEINQAIEPLRIAYQSGLFGEGSLLFKSAGKVLEAEQLRKLDRHLVRQRAEQFEKQLDTVMASFNRTLTFRVDQEVTFRTLIRVQIAPPRAVTPYGHIYVLYQLSKLPVEKIKPLFSDAQWQKLTLQLQNAGRYEALLKAHGLLPDDRDETQEDAP